MAAIDYGAIGFKNGKLISTGFVTPMEETCGFSDKEHLLSGETRSFSGNYFLVVGNNEVVLGFYKAMMRWWSITNDRIDNGIEYFDWGAYNGWKYWYKALISDNHSVTIKVRPRNGYYVAKIDMVDTRTQEHEYYKVYFGYGVDFDFYVRTKRVNYYRSPEFFFNDVKYKISRLFRR